MGWWPLSADKTAFAGSLSAASAYSIGKGGGVVPGLQGLWLGLGRPGVLLARQLPEVRLYALLRHVVRRMTEPQTCTRSRFRRFREEPPWLRIVSLRRLSPAKARFLQAPEECSIAPPFPNAARCAGTHSGSAKDGRAGAPTPSRFRKPRRNENCKSAHCAKIIAEILRKKQNFRLTSGGVLLFYESACERHYAMKREIAPKGGNFRGVCPVSSVLTVHNQGG